jgi:hypothetical protein
MELIIDEEEIKEITLDNFINPNDHAKIIIPKDNSREGIPNRDDLTKEIIAYDAIALGPKVAGEINGVDISSAARYEKGEHIANEDSKARILTKKYDIADVATTKLMDALGLIEVRDIEKPLDKIRAASMLSNIVEKVTERSDKGGNTIQLHLYAPKQREVSKYEVIDV